MLLTLKQEFIKISVNLQTAFAVKTHLAEGQSLEEQLETHPSEGQRLEEQVEHIHLKGSG
jgi:hypothetical protein